MLVQSKGSSEALHYGWGTDILSQARAEETLTWIRAGSQSATCRGPRLEDDKDIGGKAGGTERKWVTDDSPELLDQLVQNLTHL